MNIVYYVLLILFLFVCVILTLLVLMQKGRGGGLASAFGGMGGGSAFGAKTGDVLTWATSIVFGVFLLLAIGLNLLVGTHRATATTAVTPPALPASSGESSVPTPVTPSNETPALPMTSPVGPATPPTSPMTAPGNPVTGATTQSN